MVTGRKIRRWRLWGWNEDKEGAVRVESDAALGGKNAKNVGQGW
jgi:hypothetical protein